MSKPLPRPSRSAALALRLQFLIEAFHLNLLPEALGTSVLRLIASVHDHSRVGPAAVEVGAAFRDSQDALGLHGLEWPDVGERTHVWAAGAALSAAEGEHSPREAAERLGRLCEHLSRCGRDPRRTGSYYTPRWAADFVAKVLVEGLLAGRRLAASAAPSLRILDPAAGGGAFVVAAVEALAGAAGEGPDENEFRREAARHCVFATERDRRAAEACRLAVWLAASRPGRPAPMPAENVRVKDALKTSGEEMVFDIVVGNPPWGVKLPSKQAEELARAAPDALRGHRDSCLFFLQRAADRVPEDGGIGMLLPDGILWQVRYEGLRRSLLARFRPLRLVLLGDRVFQGTTAPSCVLCVAGEAIAPAQFEISDLRRRRRVDLAGCIHEPGWAAPSDAPLRNPNSELVVPPKWQRDMLGRLTRSLRSLGQMADTFALHDVGINYSRAEAGRAILYVGDRRHGLDVPITRGRDFAPLTEVGHSAWLRHDWQERVRKGDGVSVRAAIYRRCPKILLRQTGDRPVATLDRRGAWFGRSVIAVTAPTEEQLLWLAAVLNSRPFAVLYRALTPETGRPFAQVKVSKIKLVPLPPMEESEWLAKLAERALAARDEARRECLLREIDERAAQAYNLDEDEFRRVFEERVPT